MSFAFQSPSNKIVRAEQHFNALQSEFVAWRDSSPYTFIDRRNQDFTRHSVVLKIINNPDFVRWALMMGDCVHNLRSALDHAVYDIAVHESGTNPPPDERTLMFPIGDSANHYSYLERKRISSLSAGVRAAIERVQPYNRPHKKLPPLLKMLRDFDDADKHRLLNLGFMQPIYGEFSITNGAALGYSPRMHMAQIGLVDGAEIAALIFDRPMPDVNYEFKAKLTIAVEHASGPQGMRWSKLEEVLGLLCIEVRFILDALSAAVI